MATVLRTRPSADFSVREMDVISRDTTTTKVMNPSPSSDNSFQAWLQVACGFLLYFNSWGILSAFGVFQTLYSDGRLFVASPSDISWIGAIQYSMAMITGLVAGPVYDRGYLRLLLLTGTFGVVFGHMMLSICNSYALVLLTEGFCIGIGSGCLFVCAISILPSYFNKRLGLAIGIASSGAAFGAVIYSITVLHLLKHLSFAWTVRVTGFIALITLIIPLSFMRIRTGPAKLRHFVDRTAFMDKRYMLFVAGTFFASATLSIVNSYISLFAKDNRLVTLDMSFYVVALLNAASLFGRIVPNFISDQIGPFNVISPCAVITGVLCLCTESIHSEAAVLIMTLLLGFFSAAFISMPPVCFASLTANKAQIGTRMGMGYAMAGLGYMAGAPAAGSILGVTQPLHWNLLWLYGGVMSLTAGIIYLGVRISRTGPRVFVKT